MFVSSSADYWHTARKIAINRGKLLQYSAEKSCHKPYKRKIIYFYPSLHIYVTLQDKQAIIHTEVNTLSFGSVQYIVTKIFH